MSIAKTVLAAAGFAVAAAATAADSTKSAELKTKADDRLVCFAEKTTGSQLRKRICMTQKEQEERRKADQESMRYLRRGSTASGAASNQ